MEDALALATLLLEERAQGSARPGSQGRHAQKLTAEVRTRQRRVLKAGLCGREERGQH